MFVSKKNKKIITSVICIIVEITGISIFIWGFLLLGAGRPGDRVLLYQPVPDAAEQVYVANAFAKGICPLIPVANELHPSRYSPVHSFLESFWIKFHRGNIDSVFSWSFFCLMSGMALFYFLMIYAEMPIPIRIMTLYLVLYTPIFVSLSNNIMQEPTIFLLFSAACFSWYVAMKKTQESNICIERSNWDKVRIMILFLISGLLSGAIFCIRVTNLPLILIFIFHAIWVLKKKQAIVPCIFYLSGVILCTLAVLIYMISVCKIFNIAGYGHWMPDFKPFSWQNAFIPPVNRIVKTPNYLYIIQEILGIRTTGILFGWPSPVVLLVGGFAALINNSLISQKEQKILSEHKVIDKQSLFFSMFFFLFLFALSQLVIHFFYFFNDFRFMVLVYSIIVIFGLVGWNHLIVSLYKTRRIKKVYTAILTISAFIAISGIFTIKDRLDMFPVNKSGLKNKLTPKLEKEIHERYGNLIQKLNCPVFVDKFSLLNARLLFGLSQYNFPISHLCPEEELGYGGHTVQFKWYDVKDPVDYLHSRKIWKENPDETYLYNPGDNVINNEFLDSLLFNYNKIAVYYPIWRKRDLSPFLNYLIKNKYNIKRLTRKKEFALIIISK
jgi:hypothetical protein